MNDNLFVIVMVVLAVVGIAFTIRIITSPSLPLWVKLLLLK